MHPIIILFLSVAYKTMPVENIDHRLVFRFAKLCFGLFGAQSISLRVQIYRYSPTLPLQQSQQKSYKALEGKFISNNKFTIKFDVFKQYLIKDKNKIAINPYFRHYSSKELPKLNQLGFGAYVLNQKESIIIGTYIENFDLSNSVFKKYGGDSKPSFFENITIGLVTKFGISAIIRSTTNAKPLKD